jgi:outer membrane autotransporter protein
MAALAAGLAAGTAAADFIWDGGGADDLWSTDENWDPAGAPGLDLGGDLLEFGDLPAADQMPDIDGNGYFDIGGLTFTADTISYTIEDVAGGGSLGFADGATITNASTMALGQTINTNLVGTGSDFIIDAMGGDLDIGGDILINSTLLTVTGDFDTILSGVISGAAGRILKEGDGTLTLSGDNTFFGGLELAAGTLILGHDNALGGLFVAETVVTGDSAIQSDDDDRAIPKRIEIDEGVTLTISGGFNLRLDGRVQGDGALNVEFDAIDDTLHMGRNQIYTGGTTLTLGTIVLGGDQALGTGNLTVVGDGALQSNADFRLIFNDIDIDAAATLTFSGEHNLTVLSVISGDGALGVNTDAAEDEIILIADNTFTGGTTLTNGTITLGHDNALGTGDLTLAGDGSLHSTADDRAIANDIDTGGNVLTVAGDFDLTLDGVISGAGALLKQAENTLTLTNDSTYTGDTDIDAGVLFFDDASVAGLVNVNDTGTLRGTGTVGGNLNVLDGGTVEPGASIGTLAVGGDFDLQTGGTLAVELNADDLTSDLLDVTGAATLANGSTIDASLIGEGYIVSDQAFTIIDAAGVGGVTDNGATIVTDASTVTVSLIRDPAFMPNDPTYALVLDREADAYSAAASNPANRAIGRALDSTIPIADGDPTGPAAGLLGQLDAQPGRRSYNEAVSQLSPEVYSSLTAADLGNTRDYVMQQTAYLAGKRAGIETFGFGPTPGAAAPLPGSLVLAQDDPLILATAFAQAEAGGPGSPPRRRPDDYRWGRYGKVQGVFVDQDSTARQTGFDSISVGGQFGIDYEFSEQLLAGLAVGYMYTNVDYNESLGEMDEHAIRGGPYLSYTVGDWYLDASATFAWHFYDGERHIPALGRTADGDYDGWDVTGYLGTGYRIELDRNLYLTPIASALYSHFEFDDFTESGAGGANLKVDDRDADSLRSRVGANLSYRFTDLKWEPIPYFYVGWEHEFLADEDDVDASFATGGNPFTIDTGSRDEDAVFVGFGVNVLIKHNVSAFFRFETVIADTSDASAAAGGFSVAF